MKKFIALLLAAIMCLSLCACGGNNTAPETEAPTEPELRLATTDDTEEEIVLTNAAYAVSYLSSFLKKLTCLRVV